MADTKGPRKVLIVDGDSEVADAMSSALRRHGFEPVYRRMAQGILKLVQQEKPQAVVLELSLPDADGQVLINQLSGDWDAKKAPIVVVSGYTSRLSGTNRDKVEAVLTKPFQMDALVHQVELAAQKNKW
jgi:DNA-binding response OmpR family regulator